MELFIAGGCGEHGRNCLFVKGSSVCFLVDCGKLAGSAQPYPKLTPEQILSLQYVFLTHSHADHTGTLPWLLEQGFAGTIAASDETFGQLPFSLPDTKPLRSLQPPEGLTLHWGRSGHCPGSVWYEFGLEGQTLLFSGDYTEASLVYETDPIRRTRAELAVIDCAYGADPRSPEVLRFDLLTCLADRLSSGKPVLLPVPKYGRGLELLALLRRARPKTPIYGDAQLLYQLNWLQTDRFWCAPSAQDSLVKTQVQPLTGVPEGGVCFLSDPQLKREGSRSLAEAFLAAGGSLVMTGTPERGSYSEALLKAGSMELLRYPVHQNGAEYRRLLRENHFSRAIPYHTPDFSAKREILF
mgnify:CR=1 FL=1